MQPIFSPFLSRGSRGALVARRRRLQRRPFSRHPRARSEPLAPLPRRRDSAIKLPLPRRSRMPRNVTVGLIQAATPYEPGWTIEKTKKAAMDVHLPLIDEAGKRGVQIL